ncbi:MAG: glycosyltransferase family 2 protein [Oscillospiraceae bacterium]|nr:glycosyltransferase family 2 protein [Oscillospiraceae bacterium]
MKISVVIPVYKVENYIERCVRSLMEQTFQDVEFLFVDDASPDRSMEIVRQITSSYKRNVRFLKHDENRGLPSARNTGLRAAEGEYIYHCDSDDWLEPTMLEKMAGAAMAKDADFVYCDFYLSFAGSERYMPTPDYESSIEALEKGFLAGQMKYNVWNKLVKRDLYLDNNILSPEEHCKGGEDLMMVKVLRTSSRCVRVPEALYHYNRANENAITKTRSKRHFDDIKANADDVLDFLKSHPIPDPDYLELFKLNIKLPFLLAGDKMHIGLWKYWYPEANAFIKKNTWLPARTIRIQKWAASGLFPLVRLYAWAVRSYYRLKYS